MDEKPREQWIDQLRRTMEEQDTEDLLEVWKKNDRQEWADEAFEAIRQVLSARIGSLPPQGEDAAGDRASEEPEEEDTYYSFESLVKVSSGARYLSWAFLLLPVGFSISYVVLPAFLEPSSLIRDGLALRMWVSLFLTLAGLFFYVVLRALAESMYVLADIEDNTRRAAVAREERRKQTDAVRNKHEG